MGRGVNTGALSPVGGIGEIRMRANLRKIVAYKDFAKQMVRGCQRKAAICAHDAARTGEGQGIITSMV